MKLKNAKGLDEGFLALSSLSRAVGTSAQLADVGPLLWILLRQIVPSDALALFLPDERQAHVVARYAAGAHAEHILGVTRPLSMGVAGWVAVNRRPILNAEPVLDLGYRASAAPALRSSLVVPLIDSNAVIAVLALYSRDLLAFTDDHVDMLDLLGPRLALSLVDAVIADEDNLATAAPGARSLRLVASR